MEAVMHTIPNVGRICRRVVGFTCRLPSTRYTRDLWQRPFEFGAKEESVLQTRTKLLVRILFVLVT